VEEGMLEVGRN